jgi:phage shock protein PspC (stress-responsive transcriptional regulator)
LKKLYRVPEAKKIAGVCTGLGVYFNIDPTLIRIVFLLISVFWGFGIILYLICWLAMPVGKENRK